ncbi:MAG: hypothetical protein Q4G68_00475 [Planctomycetia bacterium]|nr:hypothetical protein [Planctomycetia bacterium]
MAEQLPTSAVSFLTDTQNTPYTLVRGQGVRHVLAVITPGNSGTILEQTVATLDKLEHLLTELNLKGKLLYLNVFLREIGDKQLVRPFLLDKFGPDLPAVTYIPQTPCDGSALTMEIYAIGDESRETTFARCGEGNTRVTFGEVTYGLAGGLIPADAPVASYARSLSTFERMAGALDKMDMKMVDLLRTWIYQGHIVLPEGSTQRYKELNRARTDFFRDLEFLRPLLPCEPKGAIFPASTGIGADDGDVTMAAWGIKTQRTDVIATPLENPDQTPAFDYGEVYSPQSPKFSRAMAFAWDELCTVLISGTASITDSETRYIGDPVGQTNQTLDNIEALISAFNLSRHYLPGYGMTLADLGVAKVYIKYESDRDKVQAVCRERLGRTPVVYTGADVCRDDLLVEIEGIAFAKYIKSIG